MKIIDIVDKENQNIHLEYANSMQDAIKKINIYNSSSWPGGKTPAAPAPVVTNIFGLKNIRTYRGLSQNALSQLSGVSVRTIQDYEQENRSLLNASAQIVLKLARALNVHIEDLVLGENDYYPYQNQTYDYTIESIKAEYVNRFLNDYHERADANLNKLLPEYAVIMRGDLLLEEWHIVQVCFSLVTEIAKEIHKN